MLTRKFDNQSFVATIEYDDWQVTVSYTVTERPGGQTVKKTFRHPDRERASGRYQIVVGQMERAVVNRRNLWFSFGIAVDAETRDKLQQRLNDKALRQQTKSKKPRPRDEIPF